MYDKGSKKTNFVYAHYLNTGKVWTMWEGYCHHTTDGSPPQEPITEEQCMALSARKPPGRKTPLPWSDEYKESMLKRKSEAANVKFLEVGPHEFFGISDTAKAVARKIADKESRSRKPFGSFDVRKVSRPDMAANEKRWRREEIE